MKDLIEIQILNAVRGLLTGRVNELLGAVQYAIPVVEISNNRFGDYNGADVISPTLVLSSCERSDKERIIKIDTYSLTLTFTLPETPDSELHCYVYAWAVCKALEENATLGGIVDRAEISEKKYITPKKLNCGQGWEVAISLRVTIETMM